MPHAASRVGITFHPPGSWNLENLISAGSVLGWKVPGSRGAGGSVHHGITEGWVMDGATLELHSIHHAHSFGNSGWWTPRRDRDT